MTVLSIIQRSNEPKRIFYGGSRLQVQKMTVDI